MAIINVEPFTEDGYLWLLLSTWVTSCLPMLNFISYSLFQPPMSSSKWKNYPKGWHLVLTLLLPASTEVSRENEMGLQLNANGIRLSKVLQHFSKQKTTSEMEMFPNCVQQLSCTFWRLERACLTHRKTGWQHHKRRKWYHNTVIQMHLNSNWMGLWGRKCWKPQK